MDEMKERAARLEPRVQAIGREADVLDRNFRWYIDACYQKYTHQVWAGNSLGSGAATERGHAIGRDWFAVWGSRSQIAWQESWAGSTTTNNESTVECRKIWSDIEYGSTSVARGLDAIEDAARREGVLPGHVRELLARYRLVR